MFLFPRLSLDWQISMSLWAPSSLEQAVFLAMLLPADGRSGVSDLFALWDWLSLSRIQHQHLANPAFKSINTNAPLFRSPRWSIKGLEGLTIISPSVGFKKTRGLKSLQWIGCKLCISLDITMNNSALLGVLWSKVRKRLKD